MAEPSDAVPPTRLATGTRLPVVSTKFDGSPHYRHEVTVVDDAGDRLAVWGPAGITRTARAPRLR